MLLAVEGGGFFSSSASGYSKGLTLLLLGRKNEERPMRVSPWNQYQLVDQEADTDFQLASGKNQDALSEPPAVSDKDEACIANHGEDKDTRKVCLKSSLKKPSSCAPVPSRESRESDLHVTPMPDETGTEFPGCTERRKVQWTDTCGRELVEIREFELSDVASDEELEGENERSCSCVIM
uniref:Uncharacterized protein n=1 Tax=Nelumbo nucifera TaxID=4432 RepID=A0A822XPV4_NELNU|nr:TPA_asm: hypothetical protein HUJ06_023933 [Nelumbo nucifera]